MTEMIVYEFVFIDEDGEARDKDIWAHYEAEAWRKADDWAYANGYVDFRLKED